MLNYFVQFIRPLPGNVKALSPIFAPSPSINGKKNTGLSHRNSVSLRKDGLTRMSYFTVMARKDLGSRCGSPATVILRLLQSRPSSHRRSRSFEGLND